jgi:hypothetical protein
VQSSSLVSANPKMLRIDPRSSLLPHNSFIAKNTDPYNTITIRFVQTLQDNSAEREERTAFRSSYSQSDDYGYSHMEYIKDYPFKVTLPTKREYQLKPFEAVTFTIIGGLQPTDGLSKDCLLKSAALPMHNFRVEPLYVYFKVEYKDDEDMQRRKQDKDEPDQWRSTEVRFLSTFTKQLPVNKCAFVYDVTVSTDPVELLRCCPEHSPVYDQNVFPYFPHGRKLPISEFKKPNCTCCQ